MIPSQILQGLPNCLELSCGFTNSEHLNSFSIINPFKLINSADHTINEDSIKSEGLEP